ncbi:MAG: hypothetical protein JXR29_13215 [Methylothermaceae bacterium]|nr:hypothetical protein [Methylothermaceae bacterium]
MSTIRGCEPTFRFPEVKLLDWEDRWLALETSDNVFAVVVMARLRAKTSRDADERGDWKFRPVRLLYERGYERALILELSRLIDWMIRLPDGLERQFLESVYRLEEAKKMPYVTSAERFGIEKGKQQGEAAILLRLIERKYGVEAAAACRERVLQTDAETLLVWSERVLNADTLEEIFR